MDFQSQIAPLTEDEVASLQWIGMVATRVAIPVAHMEKLLAAGYAQESVTGLVLTDLGIRRLEQEEGRDQADGRWTTCL
jgi:hypothetical protein